MSTPPISKPTPAITSANLPKAPVAPVAAAQPAQLPVHDTPIIKAVPLADPDFSNLLPRNGMHQLYWANRTYQNGFRTNYRMAQGFRLARKEDAYLGGPGGARTPVPESMIDPTGAIVNGDLVLVIIGKNAYQGALLNNHNKAIRRANKFGQVHQNWKEGPGGELVPVDGPTDVVQATLGEVRASPSQRSKVSSFVPGAAELNAALDSASVPEKP